MAYKTFVRRIDWLPTIETGWGNGYVAIPVGHPAHGVPYNDIDVDVHGGLTFSDFAKNCSFIPVVNGKLEIDDQEIDPESWIVGFDTAHYGDNMYNCRHEDVLRWTEDLERQLRAMQ